MQYHRPSVDERKPLVGSKASRLPCSKYQTLDHSGIGRLMRGLFMTLMSSEANMLSLHVITLINKLFRSQETFVW
uniref:Uncharacterized protein n=1 Tax=mine drainage metagenome TaxID=410659 RepID=E6QRH9_9ZZZZ